MVCLFFVCMQTTAFEMRISDWSSDVCASDLLGVGACLKRCALYRSPTPTPPLKGRGLFRHDPIRPCPGRHRTARRDRKRVVKGKSVSVRVDLGGRRIIQKKKNDNKYTTDHTLKDM